MGRLFDSKQFRTDLQLSGSFSGSFIGDGSSLTNVPATGIVGLNLSQIGSGSATASISPDNGLHVNTSISASIISGSILVTAPTGSFKHIITDDDTIEFRNKSTGIQTGRLKFDSENGLNVEDSAGGRTRIRAGFGKFLQLESFSSFNSIGPLTASIISASSTIFANDIEAFRMNVTHLTSSFITASTIETSGSNIFGDESSDTHTFVGDIIAQNNISSSGYISASNFIGDGSSLTGVDSIYTANGNILETRTINDRDGGFTGTAGSNALKMNVRNSGALLVAGYQNNGDPGTTNHLIQWGPGQTDGSMNVRGKLGLTSGGGRIDLTNSGGSQYFTVAQSGITSIVPLSATNITGSNISASGIFTGDGSGLINIPASGITGLNLSQIASGSVTASIAPDKGFQVNTNTQITGSLKISGSVSINDSLSNIIISTIGSGSSNATTVTGDHNIVIGMNAAEDLGASSDNVIIGNRAASGSVFSSTRENNVIIGTEAGADADMVDGANVVYIGYRAGYETTGYGAIHIGANAGQYADGNGNVSVGQNSMMGHASYGGTPLYNVVIGYNAGQQFWDGDNNVAIGSYAMANTAQHYNTSTGTVAIGSGAIRNNRKNNYTTAIGFNALYALKGNDTAAGNQITTVGAYAGYTEEYGYNHTLIGYRAGYDLTASTGSIVIGHDAGSGISYMDRQLFIGSGSTALISGSLSGGLKLLGQVSASSYIGDGSGLTGISTTPFPFSGDAVITGSLTVSASAIDFSNATSVSLPAATVPLVNPIVEYVDCGAITSSGTTVPLPNGLTFISSSVYEYIEIFINGLRMRYDVDFMPATSESIKYFVTIPSGSEITYKSLRR